MLIFLSLAIAALGEPQHYVYEGELAPTKVNQQSPDVRFTIHFVEESPTADSIYWFLETPNAETRIEETFGVFKRDAAEQGLPHIAYLRPESRHKILIGSPWSLAKRDLTQAKQWSEGDFSVKASPVADSESWRVKYQGKYGRNQSALVNQNGGVVTSFHRTLFMGQGVEHELQWRQTKHEPLFTNATQSAMAVIEKLTAWRGEQENQPANEATADSLARLKPILQSGAETVDWEPFDRFLAATLRTVDAETNRDDELTRLVQKTLGKDLPEFELELVAGGAISREDLSDKVVVLHFWKYRTTPLRKPYGQVGYLDFLRRQLPKKDVAIFGVSVDPRAEKTAGRQAVIRDAEKMREFMNLSYPILVDDGSFLSAIGDPRSIGIALPLFVVVDRGGKIKHFHPGIYPTETNAGLRVLEKAVQSATK